MNTFAFKNKTYNVDSNGYLIDYEQWDENFAEGMAPEVQIIKGLSEEHWKVIRFIRDSFKQTGEVPLVYKTCKSNGLFSKDLKRLFPTGYLRGACLLAGITYKERLVNYFGEEGSGPRFVAASKEARPQLEETTYRVDVRGFLLDPTEWDQRFAIHKAHDMKIPGELIDKHWKIIHFLRDSFAKNGVVPTVYETCEANQIELDELERLFPDGYHRGAIKISGLRVR